MNLKIGDLIRFPFGSQFAGEIGVIVQISEEKDIFNIYIDSQNLAYKYSQKEVEDFEIINEADFSDGNLEILENLEIAHQNLHKKNLCILILNIALLGYVAYGIIKDFNNWPLGLLLLGFLIISFCFTLKVVIENFSILKRIAAVKIILKLKMKEEAK